jgi:hypothetical protein
VTVCPCWRKRAASACPMAPRPRIEILAIVTVRPSLFRIAFASLRDACNEMRYWTQKR